MNPKNCPRFIPWDLLLLPHDPAASPKPLISPDKLVHTGGTMRTISGRMADFTPKWHLLPTSYSSGDMAGMEKEVARPQLTEETRNFLTNFDYTALELRTMHACTLTDADAPVLGEVYRKMAELRAAPKAQLNLVISKHLAEVRQRRQVRFPRSKRKRIQKKWRKDERNYADVVVQKEQGPYLINGVCVVGPRAYKQIKDATFLDGVATSLKGHMDEAARVGIQEEYLDNWPGLRKYLTSPEPVFKLELEKP